MVAIMKLAPSACALASEWPTDALSTPANMRSLFKAKNTVHCRMEDRSISEAAVRCPEAEGPLGKVSIMSRWENTFRLDLVNSICFFLKSRFRRTLFTSTLSAELLVDEANEVKSVPSGRAEVISINGFILLAILALISDSSLEMSETSFSQATN
jgi:hypothetical protein